MGRREDTGCGFTTGRGGRGAVRAIGLSISELSLLRRLSAQLNVLLVEREPPTMACAAPASAAVGLIVLQADPRTPEVLDKVRVQHPLASAALLASPGDPCVEETLAMGNAWLVDRSTSLFEVALTAVIRTTCATTTRKAGPIELNAVSCELWVEGHCQTLTSLESRILALLMDAKGGIVSLDVIRREAHGAAVSRSAASNRIGALRRKLGRFGGLLVCEHGHGYRLLPVPQVASTGGDIAGREQIVNIQVRAMG